MKHIFLLLLTSILFACNKNDDDDPNDKSRTELLINKKWQVTAISGKLSDGTVVPDDFSGLPDNKKDDYYFFKANLTYEINENTLLRPGSTTPIFDAGTWRLLNSDEYLEMTSNDSNTSFGVIKIIKLTETVLETRQEGDGDVFNVSFKVIP